MRQVGEKSRVDRDGWEDGPPARPCRPVRRSWVHYWVASSAESDSATPSRYGDRSLQDKCVLLSGYILRGAIS